MIIATRRELLHFHQMGYRTDEGWELHPFDWTVLEYDRLWITAAREETLSVLWRLLLGNIKPTEGWMESLRDWYHASDDSIVSRLNSTQTPNRLLESRLFDERPWLGGKPVHVQNLMERLGIDIPHRHRPYHHMPADLRCCLHTVMVVAAKAKVMLLRDLLVDLPAEAAQLLRDWLVDYPGTLIAFGAAAENLGAFTNRIQILHNGEVICSRLQK